MKKVIQFVKGKREENKCRRSTSASSVESRSSCGLGLGIDNRTSKQLHSSLEDVAGYSIDINLKDKTISKLHKAALQGNLEKLKTSVKKTDINVVDRFNRTPLHLSASQGNRSVLLYLIVNRAKVNVCDSDGKTPLLRAIECGRKDCVSPLLEASADTNIVDVAGNSCLHICAKLGFHDVAAELLKRGANFDLSNTAGEYPIHIATVCGHKDLVELLLRYGASVSVTDSQGRTPLMLASKDGNLFLVQLFLEYGARLHVKDNEGWCAEDYATHGNHHEIASLLKPEPETNELQYSERGIDVENLEGATLLHGTSTPSIKADDKQVGQEVEISESDREEDASDTWNDTPSDHSFKSKTVISAKLKKFLSHSDEEINTGFKGVSDDHLGESALSLDEGRMTSVMDPLPPAKPPRSFEYNDTVLNEDELSPPFQKEKSPPSESDTADRQTNGEASPENIVASKNVLKVPENQLPQVLANEQENGPTYVFPENKTNVANSVTYEHSIPKFEGTELKTIHEDWSLSSNTGEKDDNSENEESTHPLENHIFGDNVEKKKLPVEIEMTSSSDSDWDSEDILPLDNGLAAAQENAKDKDGANGKTTYVDPDLINDCVAPPKLIIPKISIESHCSSITTSLDEKRGRFLMRSRSIELSDAEMEQEVKVPDGKVVENENGTETGRGDKEESAPSVFGTLGRDGTLRGYDEVWEANAYLSPNSLSISSPSSGRGTVEDNGELGKLDLKIQDEGYHENLKNNDEDYDDDVFPPPPPFIEESNHPRSKDSSPESAISDNLESGEECQGEDDHTADALLMSTKEEQECRSGRKESQGSSCNLQEREMRKVSTSSNDTMADGKEKENSFDSFDHSVENSVSTIIQFPSHFKSYEVDGHKKESSDVVLPQYSEISSIMPKKEGTKAKAENFGKYLQVLVDETSFGEILPSDHTKHKVILSPTLSSESARTDIPSKPPRRRRKSFTSTRDTETSLCQDSDLMFNRSSSFHLTRNKNRSLFNTNSDQIQSLDKISPVIKSPSSQSQVNSDSLSSEDRVVKPERKKKKQIQELSDKGELVFNFKSKKTKLLRGESVSSQDEPVWSPKATSVTEFNSHANERSPFCVVDRTDSTSIVTNSFLPHKMSLSGEYSLQQYVQREEYPVFSDRALRRSVADDDQISFPGEECRGEDLEGGSRMYLEKHIAVMSNKEKKAMDNMQVAYERGLVEEKRHPQVKASVGSTSGRAPTPEEDTLSYQECSSKSHLAVLKRNLQTSNAEKGRLEENAAELDDVVQRLQYELEDSKEMTKSREEVIYIMQKQINRLEEMYSRSIEECQRLKLKINNLEQEVDHLQELQKKHEEEKTSLQEIIKLKEIEKNNLDRMIADKEEERKLVLTIKEKENESTQKELNIHKQYMESERKKQQEDNLKLEKNQEELQHKLSSLLASNQELREEKATVSAKYSAEITVLQQEVQKWRDLQEAALKRVSELEQETQDLKAIINFKISESELNKEVLTEAQQYREELRNVIQKLEGEKNRECSLLQNKIQEEVSNAVDTLKEEYSKVELSLRKHNEKLEILVNKLQQDLENSSKRQVMLETQLKETQAELREVLQAKGEKEAALQQTTDAMRHLEVENVKLKEELQEKEKELIGKEKEITELMEQNSSLQDKLLKAINSNTFTEQKKIIEVEDISYPAALARKNSAPCYYSQVRSSTVSKQQLPLKTSSSETSVETLFRHDRLSEDVEFNKVAHVQNLDSQKELQTERDKLKKYQQAVKKLRNEVELLKTKLSEKEDKNEKHSNSNKPVSFLRIDGDSSRLFNEDIVELKKQVSELQHKVKEETSMRIGLEVELKKMKYDLDGVSSAHSRVQEEKCSLERELNHLQGRMENDFISRNELDEIRQKYELLLRKTREEAELATCTQLNSRLAQFQEQVRQEKLRNSAETQMRQDFQDTKQKLLGELTKLQAALQAKGEVEKELREKCEKLSKECEKNNQQRRKNLIEKSYNVNLVPFKTLKDKQFQPKPPIRDKPFIARQPTPVQCSLPKKPDSAFPISTESWPAENPFSHVLRRELERSIKKYSKTDSPEIQARSSNSSVPAATEDYMELLKKKYFI